MGVLTKDFLTATFSEIPGPPGKREEHTSMTCLLKEVSDMIFTRLSPDSMTLATESGANNCQDSGYLGCGAQGEGGGNGGRETWEVGAF